MQYLGPVRPCFHFTLKLLLSLDTWGAKLRTTPTFAANFTWVFGCLPSFFLFFFSPENCEHEKREEGTQNVLHAWMHDSSIGFYYTVFCCSPRDSGKLGLCGYSLVIKDYFNVILQQLKPDQCLSIKIIR